MDLGGMPAGARGGGLKSFTALVDWWNLSVSAGRKW